MNSHFGSKYARFSQILGNSALFYILGCLTCHKVSEKRHELIPRKLWKHYFWAQKCPIAPNFEKSATFYYILGCLTCCKVSEKSNERILSKLRKQSFWAQKCSIAPNFGKIRIPPKKKKNQSLFYIPWCLTCCKVSEKSNERILSKLWKQSFWAQKCPIAQNFVKIRIFPKKINLSLFYILWCLICCKVSEKGNERILSKLRKQSFWAQKCSIAPNFGKIRISPKKTNQSLFYNLWYLTCCKVSEKSNERILSKLWKQSFWAQKCPIAQNFVKIRIFPKK